MIIFLLFFAITLTTSIDAMETCAKATQKNTTTEQDEYFLDNIIFTCENSKEERTWFQQITTASSEIREKNIPLTLHLLSLRNRSNRLSHQERMSLARSIHHETIYDHYAITGYIKCRTLNVPQLLTLINQLIPLTDNTIKKLQQSDNECEEAKLQNKVIFFQQWLVSLK